MTLIGKLSAIPDCSRNALKERSKDFAFRKLFLKFSPKPATFPIILPHFFRCLPYRLRLIEKLPDKYTGISQELAFKQTNVDVEIIAADS